MKIKKTKWVFNNDGAVVIHIGATDDRRSWPLDHWVKLINLLKNDFKIAIVDVHEAQQLVSEDKRILE